MGRLSERKRAEALAAYFEEGLEAEEIAARLGVTKPSVSFAMKKLRENGYILMDEENLISLTDSGEEIARRIFDRHRTITSFLVSLGVDPVIAREDACKMEHDLSEDSYEAMRRQLEKI